MTRADMARGMALLSTAFNRALTDELVSVYHAVIGSKLDSAGWERAVRRALEAESYFPAPAVLLRYGRGDGAPQARAVEMYERILRDYEQGRHLGPREVQEQYGTAAMEAFVAAGGTRAFDEYLEGGGPFRRKAFVEAWLETTEQEPARALPAGEERRLLS